MGSDSSATVKRLETGAPRRELRKELKKLESDQPVGGRVSGYDNLITREVDLGGRPVAFSKCPTTSPPSKVRDLGVALEWQGKMRQVFRAYFKKGLRRVRFLGR